MSERIATDIGDEVRSELFGLLDRPLYRQVSADPVEAGAIHLFAAVVGDGHPAWWADPSQSPPALLSAWNRPLMWQPDTFGDGTADTGLALHFRLKDLLALPRAVVTGSETEMGARLLPGMKVASEQSLVSVGQERTNRLGTGRDWTLRVTYRCHATATFLGAETLRFFGYRKAEG